MQRRFDCPVCQTLKWMAEEANRRPRQGVWTLRSCLMPPASRCFSRPPSCQIPRLRLSCAIPDWDSHCRKRRGQSTKLDGHPAVCKVLRLHLSIVSEKVSVQRATGLLYFRTGGCTDVSLSRHLQDRQSYTVSSRASVCSSSPFDLLWDSKKASNELETINLSTFQSVSNWSDLRTAQLRSTGPPVCQMIWFDLINSH
jgi:hypothetical protein